MTIFAPYRPSSILIWILHVDRKPHLIANQYIVFVKLTHFLYNRTNRIVETILQKWKRDNTPDSIRQKIPWRQGTVRLGTIIILSIAKRNSRITCDPRPSCYQHGQN